TFLTSTDEPERNSHRSFVKDISKYFKTPPTKLDYFFDPEVSEIVVRITMLNGCGFRFIPAGYSDVKPAGIPI
ncbi:MAG TPA: hypothetical protein VFV12_07445, partial [Xanthobacteraceae bacterium]|nr:hypothetical protein [Xanthobacteraceae bacterium]